MEVPRGTLRRCVKNYCSKTLQCGAEEKEDEEEGGGARMA